MPERPVLVTFVGGVGGSPVEEITAAGRRAAALDTLDRALTTGAFAYAVLVADTSDGLEALPPGVRLDVDSGPFHFGRRLAGIIEQFGLRSVVYFSGGSVPLLPAQDFADIAREMNQYVGLDLAFRPYALGAGSGGSDHSSFASVKVPFIYYMAAMTSDYHQTSDSVEKVSGELIAKISQHGFLTVFAFADR